MARKKEFVNTISHGLKKSCKDSFVSQKRNNEEHIIFRNDQIVKIKL
jgi:hypothetical protein